VLFLVGIGTLALMRMLAFYADKLHRQITYSELYRIAQENPKTQEITEARLVDDRVEGKLKDGTIFSVYIPLRDEEIFKLLRENVTNFDVHPPQAGLIGILLALSPWIIFLGIMWFVMRSAQGGGRLLAFGKSRARLISPETQTRVTFDDVAGIDEAKEELREIIEFLKDPKRFQRLGGKIPKGVLLIGLPGTGKTLLAKAVAGEANVPFYSISGSDFVEMFVGVGASRVRDLFEQARRNARQGAKGAIIFIDEIDAVGRQRFAGIGGGHDEREQTLNALLVEMDGFETQAGIILMAATNRPDVLDPALLRPGRFDRQVVISLPDIVGREAILKVHTRKIKLAKGVDLKSIARQTPGFSGADLANLANEAALLAARSNKDAVGIEELEQALERVIAGPERKTRVLNEREKKITAFHESGHALVALLTPETDPLHKVSIIPRGTHALGYTLQLPIEDRYTMSEKELLARMTVMMGGRAAAHHHRHPGEQLLLAHGIAILNGQLQRVAERMRPARDDRHLVERVGFRGQQRDQRMAGFMERRDLLLSFVQDPGLALGAGDHALEGLLELLDADGVLVRAGREEGRLIGEIGEIRAGEPRRLTGDGLEVHALGQLDLSRVDLQDRFPPHDVWKADDDLAVEPARPQQRRIQDIRPIRRRHQNDACLRLKPIHLDQERVERLLALIVAAADAGEALAAHRVDLIDKDDRALRALPRVAPRLLEQIAHA